MTIGVESAVTAITATIAAAASFSFISVDFDATRSFLTFGQ